MKTSFRILLIVIMLCLSACNTHKPNSISAHTPETAAANTSERCVTDATSDTTTAPETHSLEIVQLPLPKENLEFSFLSGAGAWRTIMTLNRNATFTGWYLDSEMGEVGDDYPNGSAYICVFSGTFTNIEKVNEYSYKMTLTDIKTEKPVGEEWIEDNIRYVASAPHGLNDPINEQECTDFIFYLPDTPVDQVPEAFLTWWPHRYTQETEPNTTLSCYGILNVTTNFGFFTTE